MAVNRPRGNSECLRPWAVPIEDLQALDDFNQDDAFPPTTLANQLRQLDNGNDMYIQSVDLLSSGSTLSQPLSTSMPNLNASNADSCLHPPRICGDVDVAYQSIGKQLISTGSCNVEGKRMHARDLCAHQSLKHVMCLQKETQLEHVDVWSSLNQSIRLLHSLHPDAFSIRTGTPFARVMIPTPIFSLPPLPDDEVEIELMETSETLSQIGIEASREYREEEENVAKKKKWFKSQKKPIESGSRTSSRFGGMFSKLFCAGRHRKSSSSSSVGSVIGHVNEYMNSANAVPNITYDGEDTGNAENLNSDDHDEQEGEEVGLEYDGTSSQLSDLLFEESSVLQSNELLNLIHLSDSSGQSYSDLSQSKTPTKPVRAFNNSHEPEEKEITNLAREIMLQSKYINQTPRRCSRRRAVRSVLQVPSSSSSSSSSPSLSSSSSVDSLTTRASEVAESEISAMQIMSQEIKKLDSADKVISALQSNIRDICHNRDPYSKQMAKQRRADASSRRPDSRNNPYVRRKSASVVGTHRQSIPMLRIPTPAVSETGTTDPKEWRLDERQHERIPNIGVCSACQHQPSWVGGSCEMPVVYAAGPQLAPHPLRGFNDRIPLLHAGRGKRETEDRQGWSYSSPRLKSKSSHHKC